MSKTEILDWLMKKRKKNDHFFTIEHISHKINENPHTTTINCRNLFTENKIEKISICDIVPVKIFPTSRHAIFQKVFVAYRAK
jgi:hypothetical protein